MSWLYVSIADILVGFVDFLDFNVTTSIVHLTKDVSVDLNTLSYECHAYVPVIHISLGMGLCVYIMLYLSK